MLCFNDIRLLVALLAANIAETQHKIDDTNVDEARQVGLENRLIVLVSLKRKLEQASSCKPSKSKQLLEKWFVVILLNLVSLPSI
jgi:hypothetical protein